MTVSIETNKSGPYSCNGSTVSFPFNFRILDATHIEVIKTIDGVDTTVSPTAYSVTGVGNANGGTVVFNTAPLSDRTVTIIRNVPFTQPLDLENQGAFYAQTIEDALDLAVMRDQQIAGELDRAVKVPVGGLGAEIPSDFLPAIIHFSEIWLGSSASDPTVGINGAALSGGEMYFNAATKEYRVFDGSTWRFHSGLTQVETFFFTATSGQTTFSGTDAAGATVSLVSGALMVSVNGIGPLHEGMDFSVRPTGDGITMSDACADGDEVQITSFRNLQFSQINDITGGAASRAEGAASRAEEAAARAEVAASIVGVEACTFRPRDYIPAAQMVHILNGDVAAQDEAVVTAGLRAMHDAAMSYVKSGGSTVSRIATCVYTGTMAISRELFSDTFAADLWALPQTQNKFAFVAEWLAVFQVKNWADGVARVRNNGMWAGVTDPVPTAVFRWEQPTSRGTGPIMRNLRFVGMNTVGDPIAIKGLRLNKHSWHNVEVREFRNTAKHFEGVVNARGVDCILEGCGLQPTQAMGSGFISPTVRFSVSGANVAASEPVFTPGHVSAALHISDAGGSGVSYSGTIAAYIDSTHVTYTSAAPVSVSGKTGSFGCMTCTGTSGSATLIVPFMPTALDLVGRYVTIVGGDNGSSGRSNLTCRVIAQGATTLTLATPLVSSVTNAPLIVAPQEFVGITADAFNGSAATVIANDYREIGQRSENPRYDGSGAAVTGYYAGAFVVDYISPKWHGQSDLYNNYAANLATLIFDDCPAFTAVGARIEWGCYDRNFGAIAVMGADAGVLLPEAVLGGTRVGIGSSVFWLAPKDATSASGNWGVGVSGHNTAPITFEFAGFGAYATAKNIYALGPVTQDGYAVGTYPQEPLHRVEGIAAQKVGIGGDPSETAGELLELLHAGPFTPLVMQNTYTVHRWGPRVSASGSFFFGAGETYSVEINPAASADSLRLMDSYVQVRKPRLTGVPSYTTNAAALAAGLVAGDTYQISGTNPRQLAIVY